tara:strand:+ start:107 stop:652 length:546 start_codon:yes stop_codon:yes gene_type:complete
MNKLEEQLDYLHYQVELHITKRKGGAISGSKERGYRVCQCTTERFINYSSNQQATRAAFISTWLIGFNASNHNSDLMNKYNFVAVSGHGMPDDECSSWLVSPPHGKKTFFNNDLIWEYFEEALKVYKSECTNHREMYQGMLKSIKRMEEDDTSDCLTATLDKAFEDDLEYLKEPYLTLSWK